MTAPGRGGGVPGKAGAERRGLRGVLGFPEAAGDLGDLALRSSPVW